MSVPILGQSVEKIHPQVKLNATEEVRSAIKMTRDLGTHHGRFSFLNPLDTTNIKYLLFLDVLRQEGCEIVAITEYPVATSAGHQLHVSIVFKLPIID